MLIKVTTDGTHRFLNTDHIVSAKYYHGENCLKDADEPQMSITLLHGEDIKIEGEIAKSTLAALETACYITKKEVLESRVESEAAERLRG